jgi:purine-nucleoside phosphorylase
MSQDRDADILIHPKRGRKEQIIPQTGILLVNPSEAASCHLRLRQLGGYSQYLFNSELTIAAAQKFFVAGPAIGAPMAAMTMEKLIALGAKRIILFGWCGALARNFSIGDILLPNEAISGEGTSEYYPLKLPASPSLMLRINIENVFHKENMTVSAGRVWSTDAVYRESRLKLQELHSNNNVSAVDMEFSALCSVACFRNIQFAAVLIVSDELWGSKWNPGFSSGLFLAAKAKALNILLTDVANLGG